jgi:ribosomal protein S6
MEKEEKIQVYELGYHVVPTIGEVELGSVVTALKDKISEKGGVFIQEEFPTECRLEYTVIKDIENKKERFDRSFFGWLKFEMNPEMVSDIDEFVTADVQIIRYLLVKTVKENTVAGKKFSPRGKRPEGVAKDKEVPQLSQEEIDKQIEALVGDETTEVKA